MKTAEENKLSEIKPIPSVNAVIRNAEGQVLLTHRSKLVRAPGYWCLPGGHLDGGEDWETAIKREVFEEVGLRILEFCLLGVYSDPNLTTSQDILPEGYRAQFVAACFLVISTFGEVRPNLEVDDWGWFTPTMLPSPMLKSHPVRIQDAYDYKGKSFVR